jgi:hypothetical protein
LLISPDNLMIKSEVLMVLFDPGLNGTPSLSSVDLPTFTGNALFALCFQAKVTLGGLKEIDNLRR